MNNSKPTLVWLMENNLSSTQKVEASYLTYGINWRSDKAQSGYISMTKKGAFSLLERIP